MLREHVVFSLELVREKGASAQEMAKYEIIRSLAHLSLSIYPTFLEDKMLKSRS